MAQMTTRYGIPCQGKLRYRKLNSQSKLMGSGSGSFASGPKGRGSNPLISINCFVTKINEKEAGNGPTF